MTREKKRAVNLHSSEGNPLICSREHGELALAACIVRMAVTDGTEDWLRSDDAKNWTDLISAASGVRMHHDFFLRGAARS